MHKCPFAAAEVCCKAPAAPGSQQTLLQSCIHPPCPQRTHGAARLGDVGGRKNKYIGWHRAPLHQHLCKASRIAASKPHSVSSRSPRGAAGGAPTRPPQAALGSSKGEQRAGSALRETLQRAGRTAPSSCLGNLLSHSLRGQQPPLLAQLRPHPAHAACSMTPKHLPRPAALLARLTCSMVFH